MMKRLLFVFVMAGLLAGCQAPKNPVSPRVVNALAGLPELVDSCGIPVMQYYYFSPLGDLHKVVRDRKTNFDIPQPINEHSIFQADRKSTL